MSHSVTSLSLCQRRRDLFDQAKRPPDCSVGLARLVAVSILISPRTSIFQLFLLLPCEGEPGLVWFLPCVSWQVRGKLGHREPVPGSTSYFEYSSTSSFPPASVALLFCCLHTGSSFRVIFKSFEGSFLNNHTARKIIYTLLLRFTGVACPVFALFFFFLGLDIRWIPLVVSGGLSTMTNT